MRRWGAALALILAFTALSQAEMDFRHYVPLAPPLTEVEKAALREAIRREEEAASLHAQQRAEIEDRLARDDEEKRRARPLGEQLLESKCQTCHGASAIDQIRKHEMDWHLTIWRMRLFNGAVLTQEEQRVIAGHLASRQGASLWTGQNGFLRAAGMSLAPILILLFFRRKHPPKSKIGPS